MYWGVIDPEGGRPTNNILLQGRLKICYRFIDLLVYKSGASNHNMRFTFSGPICHLLAEGISQEL